MMILSGLGWGVYSIIGKGAGNPTAQTGGNFVRAAFLLILATGPVLWISPEALPTMKGWVLALTSGSVTSALGYALWYRVLKDLRVTIAGLAQLSVPALAAIGGVLFVSEPLTLRFILASVIILAGVGLATSRRGKS
jgi:drug/metabolite transporter (DMT)-like permease